jgi:hypothetical protein
MPLVIALLVHLLVLLLVCCLAWLQELLRFRLDALPVARCSCSHLLH